MLQADREKLESVGADVLFVPNSADMYPEAYQTYVSNEALSSILCGKFRTGHFQGVLTVVAKLFHLVQADIALFGKKDYQQFKMISKMVQDLMFGLEIVGVPTLRDPDGLAMSSRNLRLNRDERQIAPSLYQAMNDVKAAFLRGERSRDDLEAIFAKQLPNSFRLEYGEIRYQDDLSKPEKLIERPAVILVAAHLGSVRLIDNLELSEP
jgi:pantoate--beta-alanine ligase